MRIVYVAHPISGDVARNMSLVEEHCGWAYHNRPDVIPLAPYLMALKFLDDDTPSDRLRGIAGNKEFFARKIIDEVWLFGNRISRGMWEEIGWARELNIPVVPMTKEVELELIRRELQKGDEINLLVCGPNKPCTAVYLGEMRHACGIQIEMSGRVFDLFWGDIISLSPQRFAMS